MAHEGFQQLLSFTTGADLSAYQYKLVKFSSGEIVAGTAGAAFGVLVDAPGDNEVGSVAVLGITKVVVGTGGVNAGDLITSDASAEAVAVASAGDEIVGRAMYTAAAGALTTIVLSHGVSAA